MLKYNYNNINDWYKGDDNIAKVYYGVTSGASLPYDAEIEYLENSGSQYINTAKYLTNTSNFEVGYELASEMSERDWGWVHQMNANGAWVTVSEKYAFFGKWNNSNWVVISGLTSNTENTVVYKSNSGVTVNGTFMPKTLSLSSVDNIATVPLYIFCNYNFNSGAVDKGSGTKFKSFYLKVDDTLVLDLIPVRVGQVGYMYDKVSGELFGNSGTGDFILGADKTTPLPSETVGNVVYQKVINSVTPPTPPTPTTPKWVATYTGGTITSAECNSSTSITINEITKANLESVVIGDCVSAIVGECFSDCSKLSAATINGYTSIDNYSFARNNGTLKTIIMLSPTPPPCANTAFTYYNKGYVPMTSITIYVPAASVEAYKAANGWSRYADKIQAIANT